MLCRLIFFPCWRPPQVLPFFHISNVSLQLKQKSQPASDVLNQSLDLLAVLEP